MSNVILWQCVGYGKTRANEEEAFGTKKLDDKAKNTDYLVYQDYVFKRVGQVPKFCKHITLLKPELDERWELYYRVDQFK